MQARRVKTIPAIEPYADDRVVGVVEGELDRHRIGVAIVVTDILVHGDVNLAKELIPIVIPAAIAATMADLIMGDVDRPPRKK